jgi:hypothetical protein
MTRSNTNQRGTALISAVSLAVVASGLCLAMMTTVTSRAALARRSKDGMVSMEICNSGLSLSRAEHLAAKDLDGNGIGNTEGNISGGDYKVESTKLDNTHYRLVGTGVYGLERRTVESIIEINVINANPFSYAIFGQDWVTVNGGSKGDAYDSSKGSYASQAVNKDKYGNTIAMWGCDVSSNGPITVSGTGTTIDGNVQPGVGDSTSVNGGAKVDGSTAPLDKDMDLPPIDTDVVYNSDGTVKAGLKNYSSWTKSGNASVDSGGNVVIGNGGKLTIPDGTYWVNSIKITNNGTLAVSGKVTLYVAHKVDGTGGSILNESGIPGNLLILGLGDESKNPSDSISISAKNGLYAAIYAPKEGLTVQGGGSFYGAVVGKSVKDTGGSAFHFDEALKNLIGGVKGKNTVKQISWRRIANDQAP